MSHERSRTGPASRRENLIRPTISRREREERLQRIVIAVVLAAIALVIALIAVPLLKQNLFDPGRRVAVVGDRTITRAEYDEYQRLQGTLGTDPSTLGQIFPAYRQNPEQFRTALEQQSGTVPPGEVTATGLDPLVNDVVLVESAGQAGVQVTEQDVDRRLSEALYPSGEDANAAPAGAPTPLATAPGRVGTAATRPAVTPTAGPPTGEQVSAFFDAVQDGIGVSREDYERLAVRPAIIRERYREKVVPDAAPQVHVRHILVRTREEARKVLADLEGGAKFEVLARERSQDQSNSSKGGDLGWAVREAYVPAFSKAAFALTKPGQLSGPVETEFGWHVIQLLERSPRRKLSEQQEQQLGERKLQEFIEQQRKRLREAGQLDVSIPPTPVPTAVPTAVG